jgi:hypothetical protein
MPFGSGYAPYLRSALVAGDLGVRVVNIPTGASFGQTIRVLLELTYHPQQNYGFLEAGVSFMLVEGSRIVAQGVCKSSIFMK